MAITIYLQKTLDQNAQLYFEKAKKLRNKVDGAKIALESTEKKIKDLEEHREVLVRELKARNALPVRKKRWYDKFRSFRTSEGFLVVMGRDAVTNEILIKKYTEDNDLVFHTDKAGSPFAVIKNGAKAGEASINETAQATASFSRAWKEGLAALEVFFVKPNQVSKTAQSGEFMPKGAFMITGETT